ncbi:MAG: RNA polymerase sigma factor SigM [Actinobacteria bacterium]|nr:RNA polymerase sigma factor SigM [Actinomycetota bacterium]
MVLTTLPGEQPPDAELLRRHVDGDTEAFGLLFTRHKDRLWAVAVRTMGDPEEAADALQDAMISAFRQASGFRGDSAVTTWLHRIVVNACLDRLRRRAARPTVSGLDEQAMDVLAPGQPGPDAGTSADTALDVMAALRTLPPDQQAVLVLVDMLGYSVADAGAVLGISPGTVKSRCARGRARLLPRLAHLRSRGEPRVSGTASVPAGPHESPRLGNRPGTGRVSPADGGGEPRL